MRAVVWSLYGLAASVMVSPLLSSLCDLMMHVLRIPHGH